MEISVRFRVRVGWREITLHGDDKRHEGTQALQTTVRRCYHHYEWRDKGRRSNESSREDCFAGALEAQSRKRVGRKYSNISSLPPSNLLLVLPIGESYLKAHWQESPGKSLWKFCFQRHSLAEKDGQWIWLRANRK